MKNITLSEYIKILQSLEEQHGDKQVVITEGGYYSNYIAQLHEIPHIEKVELDYETYSENECVVIGHSEQDY